MKRQAPLDTLNGLEGDNITVKKPQNNRITFHFILERTMVFRTTGNEDTLNLDRSDTLMSSYLRSICFFPC